MARRVAAEEGMLIGGSGGTAVAAALEVGRRASAPTTSSSCSSPTPGRGYLSRVFNDDWMAGYGFLRECDLCVGDVLEPRGDEVPAAGVRAPRRHGRATRSTRMREHGVSQLPVCQERAAASPRPRSPARSTSWR